MLDAAFRSRLEKPLDRLAARFDQAGISPNAVTAAGLVVGIAGCVAIAYEQFWIGLACWVVNRVADGIDGPIARRRGPTERGGYFDIMADFAIYGGVLIGLAVASPEARLAALVVLFTYYLSGSSFLAFSSLATKRELAGDGRSLNFPAGLAEGSETIAAYVIILAFPGQAEILLWIWAAIVGFTFLQRMAMISRLLRSPV